MAAAAGRPIVIKKVKKIIGGGHHGGAWKVAYADFVTAMMAFFLLMWLINTTTPEQKRGIADYFAPASVSESTSGSGSILSGTVLGTDGSNGNGSSAVIERMAPDSNAESNESDTQRAQQAQDVARNAAEEAEAAAEQASFQSAEMSIRQALQDMPELAELSKHLIIDETPEGLRIQIVDQEGRPMFNPGSADPMERARILLRAIGQVAARLPNRVTVSGHTDAGPSPAPDYTNWELSADRAQASRRLLQEAGLPGDRVYSVTGKAGVEPLFQDDPYGSGNRRISIVLLREAPVLPPNYQP
jgi:chemotaxis protein MotB